MGAIGKHFKVDEERMCRPGLITHSNPDHSHHPPLTHHYPTYAPRTRIWLLPVFYVSIDYPQSRRTIQESLSPRPPVPAHRISTSTSTYGLPIITRLLQAWALLRARPDTPFIRPEASVQEAVFAVLAVWTPRPYTISCSRPAPYGMKPREAPRSQELHLT